MNNLKDKIRTKGAVFIAGERKNAGKTTFLNYILKQVRNESSLALLTIGIDGETKDQIFGTPKPRIHTVKNDYIVTTCQAIENSYADFEILNTFPFKTTIGRIVLAKTVRSGYLELVGAENNEQLKIILNHLNNLNIEQIFIDGAVNRITQITSSINSSFFYVSKITPSNLATSIDRFKVIFDLLNLPLCNQTILNNNKSFHFKGAVTSSKLTEIPEKTENVILEDLTKVFLKHNEIIHLTKDYNLFINTKYELLGFIINLYDIDKSDFENLLNTKELLKLVYYNPYEIGEV